MKKPDKPIVCYVTDRRALSQSERTDPAAALVATIRMAIGAGVDWVQIREKDLPGGRLLKLTRHAAAAASEIAGRKRGSHAQIYVNDRLDVALAATTSGAGIVEGSPASAGRPATEGGAATVGGSGTRDESAAAGGDAVAGVHLGGESLPVAEVVRWRRAGNAPAEFQIGISAHSVEQAREAERAGADYIFFGPIFDTPSKRAFGPPQGIERLEEVCRAVRIPVIAIGGINESNARDCIRAGASGIAAIRLFQEAADVGPLTEAVRRMRGD